MNKISIIIVCILLLFSFSLKEPNIVVKPRVIEDTDLQFVNKWVKTNIEECSRIDRKKYIQSLWTSDRLLSVVRKCKLYNIPPSVVLGQMFIESRHGSQSRISDFVKTTNNYFGIEYKNFKEVKTGRYRSGTHDYKRGHRIKHIRSFSSFDSFDDCLTAYFTIVRRYPVDKGWEYWKARMCKTYATNPMYSKRITTIVEVNNLSPFDKYIKNENSSNRRLARQDLLEKVKP